MVTSMTNCDSWMRTLNAHTKHKSNSTDVNVSSMGIYRLLLNNKIHKMMTTIDAQVNNNNQCTSWQQSLHKETHNKHTIEIWECQLLKLNSKNILHLIKQQYCLVPCSMSSSTNPWLLNTKPMSMLNKITNFNQITWTLNDENSSLGWYTFKDLGIRP